MASEGSSSDCEARDPGARRPRRTPATLAPDPHRVYAASATTESVDCLWCRGRHLRGLPLGERRVALARVISDGPLILPARRLAVDGLNAWQQVLERGYEGLVAKDEQSRHAGGPSTRWLKVKVRHERDFLVGGIVDNEGDFGGVLVGERT